MEIEYIKVDPTQNMTILVETPVPRGQQRRVASLLMDYNSVFAEQTGFLEPPLNPDAQMRLQMMGGEFCGNATMSLAAYLVHRQRPPVGSSHNVCLEVSGTDDLLHCRILVKEGFYLGQVQMPVPQRIEEMQLPLDSALYNVTMVSLPGITHLVVPAGGISGDKRDFARRAVSAWEPLASGDAFGILLYDSHTGYMDPLVYVRPTQTMVWERGCGSGTAAIGSYLAHAAGADARAEISQPGGVISVRADWRDGAVSRISIEGQVRIAARGIAYLPG